MDRMIMRPQFTLLLVCVNARRKLIFMLTLIPGLRPGLSLSKSLEFKNIAQISVLDL